jgi:magnesium chelatase subunit D
MTGASRGPERSRFLPFSAVVGQEEAKTALLLAALDPNLGGVLLRGHKGSAKTTLARGLAALLGEGTPFVELPLGASEDRVVGAIDVAALVRDRTHAFRPGLLAEAHGGVLYVDEINLLADHLVDTLLDVAVSGVNRVERDGITEVHPARFVLVGSMNPEEGELRPQLLDRFGLAVDVAAPDDPAARAEIVRRQLAREQREASAPTGAESFAASPGVDEDGTAEADAALRAALASRRPARLLPVLFGAAARLALAVGAEGMRADLSLCRAAAALAGWEGRESAEVDDLRRVAPLVLAHRRRRQPFDAPGIDDQELQRALDEALEPGPADAGPAPGADSGGKGPAPDSGAAPGADLGPDPDPGVELGTGEDPGPGPPPDSDAGPDAHADRDGEPEPGPDPAGAAGAGRPEPRPNPGEPDPEPLSVDLPTIPARPRLVSAPARRGQTVAGERGRLVGTTPLQRPGQGLAVTPTVLAHAARTGGADEPLAAADLRAPVATQKRSRLVIVAVDASGSMAATRRLAVARRAVLGLLGEAYHRRDRVALVAFRGEQAEVVLRPTGSVEIARRRLADLPTGGTTPLAAGLAAVTEVVVQAARTNESEPYVVFITDGRATAGGPDPLAQADRAAAELAATGAMALVLDAESGPTRLGLAGRLARALGAELLDLEALEAAGEGAVEAAIRDRLG